MKLSYNFRHKLAHSLEVGLIITSAIIFKELLDLFFKIDQETEPNKKKQNKIYILIIHIAFVFIFDLFVIMGIEYFFNTAV